MSTLEYDLAVIGGGVSGLYCAMHADENLKVAVFEASHRFGGKLETVSMHGFDAEYGAMRFDPLQQLCIGKLLDELAIETIPFPAYASPPNQQYHSKHLLNVEERHLTTLELYKLGLQRILNVSEAEMMALTELQLETIRRYGMFAGQLLWQQGAWNALSKVISPNALRYIIMEGSFFHVIHENPNAATWLITWVKMLQMSPTLRTICHGMESLTNTMLKRIEQRGVEIHCAHVLTGLKCYDKDRVQLYFSDGHSVIAKHVVLALPEHCLTRIVGLPVGIKALLDSVMGIPLLKCFFVVEDPWWDENIPHLDMPNLQAREVHYQQQDGKGLVMVYSDRPYLNFWNQYLLKGYEARAEINGDGALPEAFAHFIGINPKRILSYGIRHWGTEPYGAACHLWKPKVKSWAVQEKLSTFSLEHHSPANIHICGEAFSDYQCFIEGALRTAHTVMKKINTSD